MVKMLKRWLPALLWMAVIYSFSSQTSLKASEFDWLDFIIKKTAHLGEYAILYLLLFRALGNKRRTQTAFLVGLAYAFLDEIHQMFSPGRTAKLRDVLIFDAGGLLIGFLAVKKYQLLAKWLKK